MTNEIYPPRLVVIVGPTASGKTDVALRLAEKIKGEIISADSMQVYRFMDIGTAKPSLDARQRVPHHMLDIVEPDEEFNAAKYSEEAGRIIQELHKREKPILLAGGTGLYVLSLLRGLIDGPAVDLRIRTYYKKELESFGSSYLHEKLRKRDEASARKIHPNDYIRIIRALEVLDQTGSSIRVHQAKHRFMMNRYACIKVGLNHERDVLYERINRRAERMFEEGLFDEVEHLLEMGYGQSLKPMQSMSYRHSISYLKGALGIEEAKRLIKRDTRYYAKRQLTWFKSDEEIEWYTPADYDTIAGKVEAFIS